MGKLQNLYLVICCLLALSPTSLIGNEKRSTYNLRQKMQERVQQQCATAHRSLAPTHRGQTRGLGPASSLPSAAKEHSENFGRFIQAELDLPYGRPDDPQSLEFLRRDPHEAAEKLQTWNDLGYQWASEQQEAVSPDWMEFAKNYRSLLRKQGIDPKDTFVPAVVIYRNNGKTKSGKTKREYRFIDPVTESFPEDMEAWNMLTKDVQFNIPFDPIFQAMREGKFPLMDAVHDVSHFVGFLRFPEFAKSVRQQMKIAKNDTASRGFKRREYWLTEALSLPDPNGQKANQQFLQDHHRGTKPMAIPEIETQLAKMSQQELVDYALESARHLESQLRDVSGGNSSPAEKWFYLSESFGMRAEDLLKEDLSRSNPVPYIEALATTYFDNGPVTLDANPKAMTNETATFSFSTFAAAQKLLAMSLKSNKPLAGLSPEKAQERLKQFASRTEFLLRQKPFTYQQWAKSFLQKDMNPNEPVASTLSQIFRNDIIDDLYLGEGEKR